MFLTTFAGIARAHPSAHRFSIGFMRARSWSDDVIRMLLIRIQDGGQFFKVYRKITQKPGPWPLLFSFLKARYLPSLQLILKRKNTECTVKSYIKLTKKINLSTCSNSSLFEGNARIKRFVNIFHLYFEAFISAQDAK